MRGREDREDGGEKSKMVCWNPAAVRQDILKRWRRVSGPAQHVILELE